VSHAAVCFDYAMESFRNDEFPEYKANRGDPPDDLEPQFDLCREIAEALGFAVYEEEGWEADDVIATISSALVKKKADAVVVTSDKDLCQLVREDGRVVCHDLAKEQTQDNPVYYIQYAHARVASLLEKVRTADANFEIKPCLECIDALRSPVEIRLLGKLSEYPEVLQNAAVNYEPHLLVYYLKELATEFHAWYDTHRVMGEAPATMKARMVLCLAVQQIIRNGLTLLGVSAPGKM